MDMNIIFVYPLSKVLIQLQAELEQDTLYTVFEVDMVDEYEQLIFSLETSITFSSDLKKTSQYLEISKKVLTNNNHLNLLVTKVLPSELVLSKMQKDGLDDALQEHTQLKFLYNKIKFFYKALTTKLLTKEGRGKIDESGDMRVERLMQDEIESSTNLSGKGQIKNNSRIGSSEFADDKKYTFSFKESPGTKMQLEKLMIGDPRKLELIRRDEDAPSASTDEYTSGLKFHKKFGTTSQAESVLLSLPEIIFFPPSRVIDPIAFFMEIFYQKSDANFKKKYLRMVLNKFYQGKFFSADQEGVWEESTTPALAKQNALEFKIPTWINQGRDEIENYFVLPVVFQNEFRGAIGLVIPGQVEHKKMAEVEFWGYIGKSICS